MALTFLGYSVAYFGKSATNDFDFDLGVFIVLLKENTNCAGGKYVVCQDWQS